jgi:ketosteroid isomerase-like protein
MTHPTITVADRLAEYCRSGQEARALDELYHPDAVSVEAAPMPGADSAEVRGLDAIRRKHAWWNDAFEVHEASVDGPFPHGTDRFALVFAFEATQRATGQRSGMREVAVYTVADGRIVREEFFYR